MIDTAQALGANTLSATATPRLLLVFIINDNEFPRRRSSFNCTEKT